MSSIKRYEVYGTHRGEKEVEDENGTYVLYDDHTRIVAELEEKILDMEIALAQERCHGSYTDYEQ